MTIDGNTNVGKLLDEHPELLETFIGVSQHFRKLENKFLRRTIARRVKVSDAAKVGGVDLDELLNVLNSAVAGMAEEQPGPIDSGAGPDPREAYAAEFGYSRPDIQTTLDVRADIASNNDPLKKIMHEAKEVPVGKILVVINGFEPIPLYEVLGEKGFVHTTERDGEVYRVLFKKVSDGKVFHTENQTSERPGSDQSGDVNVMEIDVRGLEPPEPMMKILKTLSTLPKDTILVVHHHRRPMFLYDKLEERGYASVTNQIGVNHFKIVIRPK